MEWQGTQGLMPRPPRNRKSSLTLLSLFLEEDQGPKAPSGNNLPVPCSGSSTMNSTTRSIFAVLVPVLAGAVAYSALAIGGTSEGWEAWSVLLLPAMLIGVMLVGLVFLPLWSILVHKTSSARLLFVAFGTGSWVLLCGTLVALGLIDRSAGLESTASLLVPGLILVMAFALLMDPRRVRGGEKAASKK